MDHPVVTDIKTVLKRHEHKDEAKNLVVVLSGYTKFKGGQNWILSQVGKIVLDEKNKLLFIRPKTDKLFSTYCPSKLRPSENGPAGGKGLKY